MYRKPTSTDRLLDDSSYHPAAHKSATIKTLVKRAHVVCSTNEDLEHELQHLSEVFNFFILFLLKNKINHFLTALPKDPICQQQSFPIVRVKQMKTKKSLLQFLTSKARPKELHGF